MKGREDRLAIFATILLSECEIISPNKVDLFIDRIMNAEIEGQGYIFNVLIEPWVKNFEEQRANMSTMSYTCNDLYQFNLRKLKSTDSILYLTNKLTL
jgi:hypothetical protein